MGDGAHTLHYARGAWAGNARLTMRKKLFRYARRCMMAMQRAAIDDRAVSTLRARHEFRDYSDSATFHFTSHANFWPLMIYFFWGKYASFAVSSPPKIFLPRSANATFSFSLDASFMNISIDIFFSWLYAAHDEYYYYYFSLCRRTLIYQTTAFTFSASPPFPRRANTTRRS